MDDDTMPPAGRSLPALLRRGRQLIADEAPAIAFVVAAVALLSLFRGLMFAGIHDQVEALDVHALQVWRDFVGHLAVGLPMLLMVQPVRRLGPDSGWQRAATLAVTLLLAAAAATAARVAVMVATSPGDAFMPYWLAMLPRIVLLAACLVAVGEFHRNEVRCLEAMRAEESARAALEHETLQARLRTLEAQLEPHFLFNTLANVRRLYETDLTVGEAMLARLMHYLRAALPSMRDGSPTLAREALLIEDYLELQKVRMGRRLAYRLEIAADVRDLEVPPMMLLTLVENAIKHGLAPMREGGRVDVDARLEAGRLRIEVADTGRGFGPDSVGGGTGLANIRARLQALFGAAAELSLVPRDPHGMTATIRMPVGAA